MTGQWTLRGSGDVLQPPVWTWFLSRFPCAFLFSHWGTFSKELSLCPLCANRQGSTTSFFRNLLLSWIARLVPSAHDWRFESDLVFFFNSLANFLGVQSPHLVLALGSNCLELWLIWFSSCRILLLHSHRWVGEGKGMREFSPSMNYPGWCSPLGHIPEADVDVAVEVCLSTGECFLWRFIGLNWRVLSSHQIDSADDKFDTPRDEEAWCIIWQTVDYTSASLLHESDGSVHSRNTMPAR